MRQITDHNEAARERLGEMLGQLEARGLRRDEALALTLAEAGFAVAEAKGPHMAIYALEKLAATIEAVHSPAMRELAEARPAGRA